MPTYYNYYPNMATPQEIQAYAAKKGIQLRGASSTPIINPRIAELKAALNPPKKSAITIGSAGQSIVPGGILGKEAFMREGDDPNTGATTLAKFVGGEALARGAGVAIKSGMVEKDSAAKLKIKIDRMKAIESELLAAKRDGRTKDIERISQALREELHTSSGAAEELEAIAKEIPSTKEIIGSTVQLAALAIPGAPKGSNVLAKTAIGTTQGYAFDVGSKLQDESIDIEKAFIPGLGTAIGTTIPLLSYGFSALASKNKALAEREINSLIKPRLADLSYGKNPAKAIIDEKLTAKSLDELGNKVDDVLRLRVKEAAVKAKAAGGIVDVSPALYSIDEAIGTAAKQNNQAAVNRLQGMKEALTQTLQLGDEGKIASIGTRDLTKMSIEDALNFKREIGSLTSFTGNPSDDKLVNKALKGVFGKVKGIVEVKAPELTNEIEHIASLIGAKHTIAHRIDIVARQNMVGFTDAILSATGAAASIASMNPVPFLVGVGAAGARRLAGSTSFKTWFAQWLTKAPKAQIIQVLQQAPWTKALIMTATQPNP